MISAKRTIKAKNLPSSVRIDNFHYKSTLGYQSVLDYMVKDMTSAMKNKTKMLTSSLVEELTSAFGKCACAMRGEYYTRAWELEFEGHTFIVWTASGRGTTYELITNIFVCEDKQKYDLAIRFLKQFRARVLTA